MDMDIEMKDDSSLQKNGPPLSSTEPSVVEVKLRRKSLNSTSSSSNNSKAHRSLLTQSLVYPTNDYEDAAAKRRKSSISSINNGNNGTRCHSRNESNNKMSGYLEKRSRMIGWKRYWFVLDGNLLTYYKSKADYDSLSACSGSINLGLASTVRPLQIRGCKGYPLEITTRSQTYYLRSVDKPVLEKWLIALQETTSVAPNISSPTWTDPGVQFYRYSFAPGSQWSLAISNDDISGSLRDLPKNFYLKTSPLLTNNYLGSMKKCQSLASLQHPTTASTTSPKQKFGPRGLEMRSKSPQTNDTGSVVAVVGNSLSPGSKRVAASMLVLEASTPAAMEFRKELTQKISAAGGKPFAKPKSPQSPKFLSKSIHSDEDPHQYDEIIDFEANYNPQTSSESGGNSRTSTTSSNRSSNSNSYGTQASQPDCSYLSTDYEPIEVTSTSPWERRIDYGGPGHGGSPNRNSLVSIEEEGSSNVNKVGTAGRAQSRLFNPQYEEMSQSTSSLNSGRSDSFKKKKGFGGFFQKIFKKDEQKKKGKEFKDSLNDLNDRGSSSVAASNMIITGPVDLKSLNKGGSLKAIKPTTLTYADALSQSSPSSFSGTTPQKAVFGSQNLFPNNDNVLAELKVKVGQRKLAEEAGDNNFNMKNANITDSKILKTKHSQKSIEIEDKEKLERSNLSSSKQTNVDNSQSNSGKMLMTVPTSQLEELLRLEIQEKENQQPEEGLKSLAPKLPPKLTPAEEYQSKLAKFNRLSAQLNPTFVAALLHNNKPSTSAAVNGHNIHNNNNNNGNGEVKNHQYVNIARSYSLSAKEKPRNSDEPPILPPKKRQKGGSTDQKAPAYDIPKNNQPIIEMDDKDSKTFVNLSSFYSNQSSSSEEDPTKQIRLLRDLTKKNSAPDVVFSRKTSSCNAEEQLLLPSILHGSDNGGDQIPIISASDIDINKTTSAEPPSYAPPPPPPPEFVINETNSQEQAGGILLCDCVDILNADNSPPISTKSIDIDNLDGLSDISISTPPNTPYLDKDQASFQPFFLKGDAELIRTSKVPSIISHIQQMESNKGQMYSDGDQKPSSSASASNELQLKYATINTLVTELETVEENDYDEVTELYDDFPTEFIHSIPTIPGNTDNQRESENPQMTLAEHTALEEIDEDVFHEGNDKVASLKRKNTQPPPRPPPPPRIQSVRHSGIDALQKYLYSDSDSPSNSNVNDSSESNNSNSSSITSKTSPSTAAAATTGKINRLGHSAAVNQLQSLLTNNNQK